MAFLQAFEQDVCCNGIQMVEECLAIQRLTVILQFYQEWCDGDDHDEGMYVWINTKLNEMVGDSDDDDDDDPDDDQKSNVPQYTHIKLLNDYNHLLMNHNKHFASIYAFFVTYIYDDNPNGCLYSNCATLTRSNRDRTQIKTNNDLRKKLYHGYGNNGDENEINVQQTIDRIHCMYLHSYDLGYKLSPNDLKLIVSQPLPVINNDPDSDTDDDDDHIDNKNNDNDNDDNDENPLLYTSRLSKIRNILNERRNRDTRGRNDNNNTSKSNKFTTIIEKTATKNVLSDILSDNDDDDDVPADDDYLYADDDDNQPKTISKTKKRAIVLRKRSDEGPGGGQYSFGYRYYYWDYYKNNGNISQNISKSHSIKSKGLGGIASISDVSTTTLEPGNIGYDKYSDWYIKPIYSSLKEELINNIICSIALEQWKECVVKAKSYLLTSHGKTLISDGSWKFNYDISDGNAMYKQHMVALLLYCNYDELQCKFSDTFRRKVNESDDSLKLRHTQLAHWGRYLREAVELYGQQIDGTYYDYNLNESKIDKSLSSLKFYHGINCPLLFGRTIGRFNGPTSTTTTISVAMAFTNSEGLCLQLIKKGGNKWLSYFNCVPISDFSYEEERFFIGGFEPLQISTIINTVNNENYRKYVKALNIIQSMIEDTNHGWSIYKISSTMKSYIRSMFKYLDIVPDDKKHSIPLYIANCFKLYSLSVKHIYLNLEAINTVKSIEGKYGFCRIRKILMIPLKSNLNPKDKQLIKFDYICRIFRNIISIKIQSGVSVNMVILDDDLMKNLIGFIQADNVKTRYQGLNKIIIDNPSQWTMKLDKAIKKYSKKCFNVGWILSKQNKNDINNHNKTDKLILTRIDKNNTKNKSSFFKKIKKKINK